MPPPTSKTLTQFYIQGRHLEKICEYLNCEPSDLYEWKPAKDTQSPETTR
ncbi:MAG: helix-turn-helix domain-containing protein [Pyrinomonadaceae bacterium]